MIHPDRIGHIVLKVRSLKRSRPFYTEVLGLEVMKELPEVKMLFLASNRRDHHEIALAEVGEHAGAPKPGDVGLAHCAFRLKSLEDLHAAYREFKEARRANQLHRQPRSDAKHLLSRSRRQSTRGLRRITRPRRSRR